MSLLDTVHDGVRERVRMLLFRVLGTRDDALGNLFDPANTADPYPVYADLQRRGDVLRGPLNALSASHEVVNAVLRHPDTTTATGNRREVIGRTALARWLFNVRDLDDDLIDPLGSESMIGMDGADHARLRRLVSMEFTPKAIAALRPALTARAHAVLDEALDGPSFDLMTQFAHVFPVQAICEVLGVPEQDHDRFKAWGEDMAVSLDAVVSTAQQRRTEASLRALQAYLGDLIEVRRRDPGDDLVSRLAVLESEGDTLTNRELLSTCMLLLVAGFETTTNLIGNGALALARDRGQLEWLLANPDRAADAVEELLRWDAPVQVAARYTGTELTADDGSTVPVGSPITLFIGAANRDPAVFDHADVLDLGRADARRHLAFAAGPHYCLGAALARLEGEIAFTALLERLGDLRLAGAPVRRQTFVLRGLASLPLQVTAP